MLSKKSHLNDESITEQHWNPHEINFPQFQPVCPLSHQGVAACSRPLLQPSYQRSHQPVSSRHAITLSNETGEAASKEASCEHTVPKSITSLFPPFFLSMSMVWSPSLFSPFPLYPDWPVQYSGSWLDECGGKKRDWRESDCHTVIGTKTWCMLCLRLAFSLSRSFAYSVLLYPCPLTQ